MGPPGPRLKDCSHFLPPSNHLEYYIPLDVLVFDQRLTLVDQITCTLEHIEKCRFEQFRSDSSCCSWKVTLYEKNWTRNSRRKRKFAAGGLSDTRRTTQVTCSGNLAKDFATIEPDDNHEPILQVKLALNQYHPTSQPENSKATSEDRTPSLEQPSSSRVKKTSVKEQAGLKISIDWLFGKDRDLFLSFWNHVLKKKSCPP